MSEKINDDSGIVELPESSASINLIPFIPAKTEAQR